MPAASWEAPPLDPGNHEASVLEADRRSHVLRVRIIGTDGSTVYVTVVCPSVCLPQRAAGLLLGASRAGQGCS